MTTQKAIAISLLLLTGCQSIGSTFGRAQSQQTFYRPTMSDPFLETPSSVASPSPSSQGLPTQPNADPIPTNAPIAQPEWGADPFLSSPAEPADAPVTSDAGSGFGNDTHNSIETSGNWRPTRSQPLAN